MSLPAAADTGISGGMTDDTILTHEYFMQLAIAEAVRAGDAGEVPVGAVIRRGNGLIARAHNQVELLKDPTAHAEVLAITQAAEAVGDWRLEDTTLYVTKEPCAMCAGAAVLARIPRVVFGIPDPQRGGAVSVFNILSHPNLNHRCEIVSGILETPCKALLQDFFRARRDTRK